MTRQTIYHPITLLAQEHTPPRDCGPALGHAAVEGTPYELYRPLGSHSTVILMGGRQFEVPVEAVARACLELLRQASCSSANSG